MQALSKFSDLPVQWKRHSSFLCAYAVRGSPSCYGVPVCIFVIGQSKALLSVCVAVATLAMSTALPIPALKDEGEYVVCLCIRGGMVVVPVLHLTLGVVATRRCHGFLCPAPWASMGGSSHSCLPVACQRIVIVGAVLSLLMCVPLLCGQVLGWHHLLRRRKPVQHHHQRHLRHHAVLPPRGCTCPCIVCMFQFLCCSGRMCVPLR
jgi:hypothetical protein